MVGGRERHYEKLPGDPGLVLSYPFQLSTFCPHLDLPDLGVSASTLGRFLDSGCVILCPRTVERDRIVVVCLFKT